MDEELKIIEGLVQGRAAEQHLRPPAGIRLPPPRGDQGHRGHGTIAPTIPSSTPPSRLIQHRGSIHLPSEMADQIKEINNEIWYRGEHGDYNRSKIQEEWAMRYASMWRNFRIKEILFVCDQKAPEIEGHPQGEPGRASRPAVAACRSPRAVIRPPLRLPSRRIVAILKPWSLFRLRSGVCPANSERGA